jgi:hypothetical protein
MTQPKSARPDLFGYLSLFLLGSFSILYSTFWSKFAELNLQLPFLNFPIFIGEVLLFIGLMLSAAKLWQCPVIFHKAHGWILVYVAWLLIKAFQGYAIYGPLAFRTSALFYYPLFFIFGYLFFNRNFFTRRTVYFLALLLLVLQTGVIGMWGYYRPAYLMLSIVIGLSIQNRTIRYSYLALVIYMVISKNLFYGSKTHLLGIIAMFLFLLWYSISYIFSNMKKRLRLLIFAAALISLVSGIFILGREEKVKVLFNFSFARIREDYREVEALVQQRREHFEFSAIPAQLYNKNDVNIFQELQNAGVKDVTRANDVRVFILNLSNFDDRVAAIKKNLQRYFYTSLTQAKVAPEAMERGGERYEEILGRVFGDIREEIKQMTEAKRSEALSQGDFNEQEFLKLEKSIDVLLNYGIERATIEGNNLIARLATSAKGTMQINPDMVNPPERESIININSQDVIVGREYSNILFRVHIWRDMLEELTEDNAWWAGINFGKPQRSKRIEMLTTAKKEWMRDGWITPHNSYLHVIYRAGIPGIGLLVIFALAVIRMVKGFIRKRSWIGILLSGIIIYSLAIANFLVYFEFPYNAIPFWTLFGMMYAYLHELENKKIYQH